MEKDIKDKAVLATLIDRFENQRLPRLLDIRKNVEQGETLSDTDMAFLEQVFQDARDNERYLKAADDDLKSMMMKVLGLYKEITENALANEQKGK